ncbi:MULTISPECIES: YqkE family protein [Bacillales]|uniref:YqkE family protein n=1 Tax=Lysinibacillus louembei TaxID=1470088 RepID=A0ABZ0S345_9BACI|nr:MULTISPECIES: YqkE family protein [Bacillales]MCT6923667.1 YqkE family protein [Metasolibacillus sp.]MCT6939610.1 YqkE family protein [Metasolibacillus sp.]WPK11837.1 YqkE family protein [Lysinibacillus louembei]
MAKKKTGQKQAAQQKPVQEKAPTLQDQLGGDVLAKLKATKQALVDKEQAAEEERQARLVFERKQREKNMSFEELLEQYGDKGSKF